jgi:hypothetical protein
MDAIRKKGFEVLEEVAPSSSASVHKLLSPALQARVSAQDNPYLSMLGWRKDALIEQRDP